MVDDVIRTKTIWVFNRTIIRVRYSYCIWLTRMI